MCGDAPICLQSRPSALRGTRAGAAGASPHGTTHAHGPVTGIASCCIVAALKRAWIHLRPVRVRFARASECSHLSPSPSSREPACLSALYPCTVLLCAGQLPLCVLRAAFCVLRAACCVCVLRAQCRLHHRRLHAWMRCIHASPCSMHGSCPTACCVLRAACCMVRAACGALRAACRVLRATW
jgi:hypothetical protein